MADEVTAYVGIGANLGNAAQAVQTAIARLGLLPHIRVVKASSLYRTAPIDAGGPDYVNAVAEIATRMNAPQLLAQLQAVEHEAGRQRPFRNAPRSLDLDLLLFGSGSIDSATLTVPHPRMLERAFVLVPLAEIAPRLVSADQLRAVASQPVVRLA